MFSKVSLLAAATFGLVAADQGQWQQCGGINYSGSTTCSAGLACSKVNDYYSQCLQGSVTVATSSNGGSIISSKTLSSSTTTQPATTPTPVVDSGNPFSGYQIYANSYYASEVISLAVPTLGALAAKASAVAKVGTFVWMDTRAKVAQMDAMMADIEAKNKAGANPPILGNFVVYDLPDRDCAALASNGELAIADGGAAKYEQYIDSIVTVLKKYPTTKVILVVEPDSLANLVTNLNVAKCSGAAATYKSSVTYAIKRLNLPNVSMYLDAGHGGWLGWAANIGPAAEMFGDLYKAAGSPAAVRGLATNVANYNAWSVSTCASYTQGNTNCDEKRYINALAPLLKAQGFPAHFIVDTGRNGVQPTQQQAWGDWCNVIGTGFGARPTTNTGDALVDAFVWVKPGGESDGTSDSSATRYDAHCGQSDSLKPAPEAGTWFGAYFEQLLKNANPSF